MDLHKTYLYRITHIDNMPHIIKNGITHKKSASANDNFKAIGDSSLISTRTSILLDNGSYLGDYIPFYFGVRSPMLYVIQHGFNGVKKEEASDIVYCVTSIQQIMNSQQDFLYTDGHATDKFTTYYTPDDIADIESQVDFKATQQKFWKDENDLDLKRRKEAEFLIKTDLDFKNILGFITFDAKAQSRLVQLGIDSSKVLVRPNFYF